MTQEEADEWARKELINWKRKDKRWRKENLFVVMWQGINKDQTEFDRCKRINKVESKIWNKSSNIIQ